VVECAGKRYPIIKTGEGSDSLDEYQILFGKFYAASEDFISNAEKELEYKQNLLKSNPNSSALAERVELLKSALANAKEHK
ncbi:MAG: hypothetical protein K2M36_05205, partial [Clostridia bacterium]|nr:hypothetical protein [Clostridia bacterium]